jgi:hypothetical protein
VSVACGLSKRDIRLFGDSPVITGARMLPRNLPTPIMALGAELRQVAAAVDYLMGAGTSPARRSQRERRVYGSVNAASMSADSSSGIVRAGMS